MLPRSFTLSQANALVPWLQQEFTVARRLSGELRELRAQVGASASASPEGAAASSSEGRQATLGRIAAIEREMKERLEGIMALGVEVRRADGLADFPAWIDGQVVYLCWKYGETEIGYFHPTTRGYDARRPLPEAAVKKGAERN